MRARSVNEVVNWLVVVLAFSIPLYRAWVSLAAALILILWFFQGGLGERAGRLRRHPLTLAILAFLALNLLSLAWSSDPLEGVDYLTKYRYLLLVPAVASSLQPRFVRPALLAFLAGTALAALMMPVVILGDLHVHRTHPGNPAVTMSHLDFSMVLAVAALLVVVRLGHGGLEARQRLAWIGLLVVLFAGLLVNIGRSGQLAFVGTLPVLIPVVLRRRSGWARTAAVVVALLVIVAAYLLVPPFQERVDQAGVEIRDAVTERRVDTNQGKRLAGMVVALDIVREHPILGTGIGGNMPEFRRLLATDHPELEEAVGWFPHLHNQYLQIATELGAVGLLSLAAIFVALFAGRYRDPLMRSAAVALGCAYLLGFLGDPYLHKQLPLVLFALAAGIISSSDAALTPPPHSPSPQASNHS